MFLSSGANLRLVAIHNDRRRRYIVIPQRCEYAPWGELVITEQIALLTSLLTSMKWEELVVFKTLAIAVLCILLLVTGQTLLKFGLLKVGGTSFLGGGGFWENVLKMVSTPYIVLGFFVYAVSAIMWLDVLSTLDFSLAFPLVSLTYVFALIIGAFVFHDHVNVTRIFGVTLILGGLFFIVRSNG